jgi:multiple sugar transport system permease protein
MNMAHVGEKRAGVRPGRRISWTAILFLLPGLAAFLLFKYYPLIQAIYMSFFDYRVVEPPGPFVGFRNYLQLLRSSLFWSAAYNTLILAILQLVLTFWVPIVQALLINEIRKPNLNLLLRFLYLVPGAVPGVAGALLWKWMYNPDYGLLNSWLGKLGLGPYGWLNDPAMAKVSIVLPGVIGGGLGVLLYYSALRGMSEEVLEASKIDGAGPWQRIWSIILPQLRFLISIQFIAFLSGAFLSFDSIYVMTGGGPAGSTRVLTMLMYDNAFVQYRFGVANAISFMLFIVVGIITYMQLRSDRNVLK